MPSWSASAPMPPSRGDTPAGVSTSRELLTNALQRSARRQGWVARRRLAWRWTLFLLGWCLRYLAPPLALA